MTRYLWPKGLVGQLLVAMAVALFLAQAINFQMLATSQQEKAIAHGGGMAVARIVDGVERASSGNSDAQNPGSTNDGRETAETSRWNRQYRQRFGSAQEGEASDRSGQAKQQAVDQEAQASRNIYQKMQNDRRTNFRFKVEKSAPERPESAISADDVAAYVENRLVESGVAPTQVTAWVLPIEPKEEDRAYRGQLLFVTALVDDRYYTTRGRLPVINTGLQGMLIWQTLTIYLLLLVPIMLIAFKAAAPMRQLTQAAKSHPMRVDVRPIEEKGPSDVRELTRAFNAYRSRIAMMLNDKDRMLGAVGHDLRTPLASLRVRVEQVDNDILRQKMISSIEEMAAMLTDILALARAGSGTETAEILDGAALMAELAADFQEQGKYCEIGDLAPLKIFARPIALRRALRNLIGNAVAYGEKAQISLRHEDGKAAFIIIDNGPGLDEAQIEQMMQPFARGEESRNRKTGGAGLGLSIAREITENEGGSLILRRHEEGGLDARIILPLA